MDWLFKHNLIKQYLQQNFKQKEFKKAIKYTLIIGIQTLYQLHGNTTTDPYVSFTLEQLSSMIVANNGTLNIQSDLPALNKCLKDIKQQLGDIQNELDSNKTNKSNSQSKKLVQNICKPIPNPNTKVIKCKTNSLKDKIAKANVVPKADNKWRIGDTEQFKPTSNAIYPQWWPKHDLDDSQREIEQEKTDIIDDSDNDYIQVPITEEKMNGNTYIDTQVQHPHIYNHPIAFNIPKAQFKDNKDNNIVQLHVNLYPEYMQKCMDNNKETDVFNTFEHRNKHINKNNKKKQVKTNKLKTLTQCTESSQAKASGNKTQKEFLKSVNRNIAPCLKHKKPKVINYKKKKNNKLISKKPKYLQNVESRIKNELKKDRKRNICIQNEKEMFMKDITKYGLNEDKNDKYYDEWKEKFGYNRLSNNDIITPSVMTVADAMMKSNIMQAINPSLNKEPILYTQNLVEINAENYGISNNQRNINEESNQSIHLLTDLRKWAQSLTTDDVDVTD
eukprot:209188_1